MRKFKVLFSIFVAISLSSCMTMVDYNFSSIDSNLSNGKYESVHKEIEKKGKSIYKKHDELLFDIDIGILNHYMEESDLSNERLAAAEKLFEKYSARSISQTVASFMSNDLVIDYSGEDFENIYTNIFMALNYIAKHNIEDAMVEVRRFDNKLKLLKSKYEHDIQSINSTRTKDSDVKVETVSIKFSDSALARYLSMILYRTDGDISNAEVDFKYLKKAFNSQQTLYDFPIPSTIDGEIDITKNQARLNILSFYGKAPIKKENITRLYYPYAGIWYKIALPSMQKRNSQISNIEVNITSKSTGETISRRLEKIESIENIAVDTFQQKLSIIKAKSLTRAITRAATNTAMDAISDKMSKEGNSGAALIFGLAGLATKVHTEATERADVRSSRYFPANAAITGITLKEGDYEVTVKYIGSGKLLYSETKNISVKNGSLNFIESKCLM